MDNITKLSIEINKKLKPETHLEFLYELIEALREQNRELTLENERLENDTLFGC